MLNDVACNGRRWDLVSKRLFACCITSPTACKTLCRERKVPLPFAALMKSLKFALKRLASLSFREAKLAQLYKLQKFFCMAIPSLEAYHEEIRKASPQTAQELEEFRLKWLSKKGVLQELFGGMKSVP